jgi:hypothetical protein
MPPEEARTFLPQLQEKIGSSNIEVRHRDVLTRLRSIIEEDLEVARSPGSAASAKQNNHSEREAA